MTGCFQRGGRTASLEALESRIRGGPLGLLQGVLGRLDGALFLLRRAGKRPRGNDSERWRRRSSNRGRGQARGQGVDTRDE